MNAWVMPDRHLRDSEPVHERERRKESVHALEEVDTFQHRSSKYLEWTSCVVDAVVSKEVPHTVGNSGRYFFHQAILPLLPPSAHEIVGSSIGEEFQDVLAVLLKIAVGLDDQFAGRLTEPRVERAGLAVVSVEVEDLHLSVLVRQAIQCITAAIAAAIVHENDFERPSLRGRM